MLAVSQVHLELLFCTRVETEICLVSEVVSVKQHLDEARLRDECLWLLGLAAEQTRVLPVAHIRLGIAIHDLKQDGGHEQTLKQDHDRVSELKVD